MIFGQQSPKIVDSADNDIQLYYSVILKDEPEFSNVMHESNINLDRNFFQRGYHWIYKIRYHLYKEGNPRAKFETLHALLGDEVTLYRHRDKDPIMDSTGTVVPFFFAELTPFYLETNEYHDALILTFKSTKAVDITYSLDATLITELSEETITTEDGESIIIG